MKWLLPGVALVCALAAAEEYRIEKIESRLAYADGPVWSREGFLLFSDIPGKRILKMSPGEKTAIFREDAEGTNGMTFDAQGRLYLCEARGRRLSRMDKKGNMEVLAERFDGKRFNGPNDVVVRKDGQVYFTDPAFGNQQEGRELGFFGVYHLSTKGELSAIARPVGRPNGIALAPNGKTLYVTNSDEKNVRAYDLGKQGEASNERILIQGIEGVPDGIRTDEGGRLYVAAKSVFVYEPGGKRVETISVGETPSNLGFGDADFASLYVTARTSVYRVRLDVKGSVQY